MGGSFQKNSLSWQVQQLGQRFMEWIQLQSLPDVDLPQGAPPPLFFQVIFWIIVLALATWLIWQLYQVGRRWLQQGQLSTGKSHRPAGVARSPTVAEWLRQAQTYQQRGEYGLACRALYMAMLQRLDDRQQIPQQPGLTDGEYLQQVATLTRSQSYKLLIQTHEQWCFGNASISADQFQRCQQAYRNTEATP